MKILFPQEKTEDYYKRHRYTEIRFDPGTKYAVGLIERDIYLIRGKTRWYCRIHTAGMSGVKVLVSLSEEELDKLKASRDIALNFSFIGLNSFLVPISLSIPYFLEGIEYRGKKEGYLVSLSNKHKPPEYLIGILGDYIESALKESNRKEERISINENSRAALGLKSKRTRFETEGKRITCRLDDLSSSGAGLTLLQPVGSSPEKGTLELIFRDPDMILRLPAEIVKYSPSESESKTVTVGLHFEEDAVPLEYKHRIAQTLLSR
jgi:hypothetical protein